MSKCRLLNDQRYLHRDEWLAWLPGRMRNEFVANSDYNGTELNGCAVRKLLVRGATAGWGHLIGTPIKAAERRNRLN